MTPSNFYRFCGVLFLLFFCAACGLEAQEECLPCKKVRAARLSLVGDSFASGLETPLYLFRRPAGTQDGYVLERTFASVVDGDALKLPLADLKRFDYRFLMLAQPADAEWLIVGTASGRPFEPGTAWEDVRLQSASGQAASDGYCGFTDMRGEAILSDGTIRLTLTRVAGQMLFDFYRMDGTLSQPAGVLSKDVESVIDRVSVIEIEYANPTTALRFDENGLLIPAAYASEPLIQRITPRMADFKVVLPQEEKGLVAYDPALRGSLRIAGAFLLASDSKLRVKMDFTYYDTTPICEDKVAHTAACFEQRLVTLRLPAAASQTGLPVAADCFTVNRAGLRCDRIIDIPVGGGIETDFEWLK